MQTFDKGNRIRVFGTFKSTGGAVGDPTSVRMRYRKPGSTETVLTYSTASTSVIRISTGAYRADITGDKVGMWSYGWDSSGVITASAEARFRITPGLS